MHLVIGGVNADWAQMTGGAPGGAAAQVSSEARKGR
jgi:hypothetical protein